jgi:hypothetical protein
MPDTTDHPFADQDARFLLDLERIVRAAIDVAPKACAGLDQDGDGRAPFSLEAWRMPGNASARPCLVTASFGAVHGGKRDAYVQGVLRTVCASRPMHIHMSLSARAWFAQESGHQALARHHAGVDRHPIEQEHG